MILRSPRTTFVALALATALTLAGCSPSPSTPDTAVSAQLEQTVLVITVAVAESNWATADSSLDELEAQVDAALAGGELTEERAAEIRAAIELVRADVAAGLQAQLDDDDDDDNDDESERDKPGQSDKNDKNDKDDD